MSSEYLSSSEVKNSYRPKGYGISPGLKRAREPFRVRNALTGLALGGFAVGVWAYSINAVKQESFDDIDEEVRALDSSRSGAASTSGHTPSVGESSLPSIGTGSTTTGGVGNSALSSASSPPSVDPLQKDVVAPRGFLPRLLPARFRQSLDPISHTWVIGAPSVDNIGSTKGASKIQESISTR
ncbi:hypothetical protein SISSUDRAFT_1030143 [Sistotremastrum suecicum HHB10207 ss-3]|uniref:Cytochrome c oxidase assembly factor 3 n=1 Tax=Sistotremastrum suecicum HHB10207 ss-3 TaxID=1314776 RepID=A0A166HPW4_9AGAM|nr:hypothetical protein SISSUDRAFT_1030143 [Sistotremastrum suecicum HHB10207 ss-3]